MRIAIVGASPVPFCRGGIESFMAGLHRAINEYTPHSAELIKIPVKEQTVPDVVRAYGTFRRTHLDHFDLVITTKYPAWNLRHRNHVIYLGHRLRGLYDTYPIPPEKDRLWRFSPLRFPGPWIKRIVHWLDNRAIRPETIAYAFCTSATIASRHKYFHPDLPPGVVYHSTIHENYQRKPGEFLFTVNRLDAPKRVDLMIRAYQTVQTDIPFVIAGTGPHETYLKTLVATDHRIRFTGDVSEAELTDLYARSLAVLYTPYAEDYGLVTIEAMKSGKPVLTTSDSGGPLEFVRHNINGWIADPDPGSLGKCIRDALSDPAKLESMGDAALQTVLHITWRNAVNQLLAPFEYWPTPGAKHIDARRRVLMCVPYPVFPPLGGGQRRVAGLAEALSEIYDVYVLSLGRFSEPRTSEEINPWLHEIRVPMAPAHARAQWDFEKAVGETVSDAALDELLPKTPNYLRALRHFAECSDIIICEQPYIFRHIPVSCTPKLIVHSSQNYEYCLKQPVLRRSRKGRHLLRRVRAAESAAVTHCDILFATSTTECQALCRSYGRHKSKSSATLPNGVDTRSIQPPDQDTRDMARKKLAIDSERYVFLFMAAWHPPNLEAFRFLTKSVAPEFPDALFLVVGSVRDHFVNQGGDLSYLPSNIRLTGALAEQDKNAALAAADVALNPMISGSGTNLKILEYAAAGIPVVSTPFGIRGLAFQPGHDVLTAEPEQFAETLRTLADDRAYQTRLAQNARQTVVERYDWRTICQSMIRTMESSLAPAGPERVDMRDAAFFSGGWYVAEHWNNADGGPGWVRWNDGNGIVLIPAPRNYRILRITLQGGFDGQKLSISLNDQCVLDDILNNTWRTVEIHLSPVFGSDYLQFTIKCDTWSPADSGSTDNRLLGVAVTSIRFAPPVKT
jgi:glycosyltransferase involved in cell wall biosynthesis